MRLTAVSLLALVCIFEAVAGQGRGRGKGRGRGPWNPNGDRGSPPEGNSGRGPDNTENNGERGDQDKDGNGGKSGDRDRNENSKETTGGPNDFENSDNPEIDSTGLTDEGREALRKACAGGKCKKQTEESKELRAAVKKVRTEEFLKRFDGDESKAEAEAEKILAKTQEAKMAVFEAEGILEFADPADTGLWGKDMSLTEEQADEIIKYAKENANNLKKPDSAAGSGSGSDETRNRRNAMYLEAYYNYKWSMPIPYTFLYGFSSNEKYLVYQAINDIQSKTCVRFREVDNNYYGSHIRFYKYTSSYFCGQSPLGRMTYYNTVYLNMGCNNMMSITAHEILHSLGIHHEQTRVDRDNYISVLWQNVNAQNYDFFEQAYMYQYTSYGVPYDYYSVMHYSAYAGSSNGQRTMVATRYPVESNTNAMGTRSFGLSWRDAEKVRRMYCTNCRDADVFCGYWANVGYCNSNVWVQQNCYKSCGWC